MTQGEPRTQLRSRGRFITLEGGEGAGKTTQIARLRERLEGRGIAVMATREPGGTPGAEAVRHVILSGYAKKLGAEAETMLFAAARLDHLDARIRPALAAGRWVLCDRFLDSTRVYQGALGKVDPALIESLERLVVGETMPDLTLILDLDPTEGLSRAAVRRGSQDSDRFESEDVEAHRRMRETFAAIAAAEPDRCALIDAGQSPDAVHEAIWKVVEERLLAPPPPTPRRRRTVRRVPA